MVFIQDGLCKKRYQVRFCKMTFQTSTCPESATPATQNGHSSKKRARRASKTRPSEERSRKNETRFVGLCERSRNAHGHPTRELLCCKGHQICWTRQRPYRFCTARLNTYRNTPSVHCLGNLIIRNVVEHRFIWMQRSTTVTSATKTVVSCGYERDNLIQYICAGVILPLT